jgi:endonuclease YncB( thermonuclease family)
MMDSETSKKGILAKASRLALDVFDNLLARAFSRHSTNQDAVTCSSRHFGQDRYDRTLATMWVDGVDVGETLIAEGLARRWPDGPEFWCK